MEQYTGRAGAPIEAHAGEVRRMRPEDWPLLRATRLAALRESPHAFARTHAEVREYAETWWRESAESTGWFVTDWTEPHLDQRPGAGIAAGRIPSPDPVLHVVSVWVDPLVRGTGAAARLMNAVIGWGQARAASECVLWVADGNDAATSFYTRLGFVLTGRSKVDGGTLEHELKKDIIHRPD